MNEKTQLLYLRYALFIFGLMFIFTLYPLMQLWPSGWRWIPPQYEYEQMIVAIYATLGVFLIRASKNPLDNISLIWFTIWSSIVHASVMLFHVYFEPHQYPHLFGDIPVLYMIAIILAYLVSGLKNDSNSATISK